MIPAKSQAERFPIQNQAERFPIQNQAERFPIQSIQRLPIAPKSSCQTASKDKYKPKRRAHTTRSIEKIIEDINYTKAQSKEAFKEIAKDIRKVLEYDPFNVYNIFVDRFLNNEEYKLELDKIRKENANRLEACSINERNVNNICNLIKKANYEIYDEIKNINIEDINSTVFGEMTLTEIIERNRSKIYYIAVNKYFDMICEFNATYPYLNKSSKALEIIEFIISNPSINYHLKNWNLIINCLSKWLNIADRKKYFFNVKGLKIIEQKPAGFNLGEKTVVIDSNLIKAPMTFKSAFGGKIKHLTTFEISPIPKNN